MRQYYRVRKQVYELFTPDLGDTLGQRVDLAIMVLIAANVVAVILATVDRFAAAWGPFFYWFEMLSVAIFTVEYLARVWSAVESEDYAAPLAGRVRFASRPLLIVDALAILPFYLVAAGIGLDLRFLRVLRLGRIFRLFKLARYSEALQSFGAVFREKKEKLLLALFANGLLLVLASSVMYVIEHPFQPETFSSIPATFYWALITLTTVGYGDVTPVTPLGQLFAGVIALLGIGLFALPASILASGFLEQAAASEISHCPHCGERLDR